MRSLAVSTCALLALTGVTGAGYAQSAGSPSAFDRSASPAGAAPLSSSVDRGRNGDQGGPTDSQIGDQVDAGLAKLKADLRLTADQDRNWPAFHDKMHDVEVDQEKRRLAFAADREQRRQDRRGRRGDEDQEEGRPDVIDGMRREADRLVDRANGMRAIADATDPLFKAMNDDQKRELVKYIREAFSQRER